MPDCEENLDPVIGHSAQTQVRPWRFKSIAKLAGHEAMQFWA
jgi:hypothetical protein